MSVRDGESPLGFLNRSITRRQAVRGATLHGVGAAITPILAACGGDSSSSTSPSAVADGTPKMGGHLGVAAGQGSAKEGLDANATAFTMQCMDMRFNLYDSLLEHSPEGIQQMALAKSLEPNAEGKQYTVKLKSDLMFHDGTPVNADAVVYGFERILDPKKPRPCRAAAARADFRRHREDRRSDCDVRPSEANAIFPEALATYSAAIVPVGYDPKGGDGVIGTGLFKLASLGDFQPGVQCVMVKNPDYWREGGGPYADKLSIIEFADTTTAHMNALLGGAVDYVNMIPGAQRDIATGAGHRLLEAKTGSWPHGRGAPCPSTATRIHTLCPC